MSAPLLKIQNLTVTVQNENARTKILDNVSFDVEQNAIVGIVGGSGSGKTTTGLAILRLLSTSLNMESGSINFLGQDLLRSSLTDMKKIRGKDIAMVFQEPLIAFNPVFTIGYQIEEVLVEHFSLSAAERHRRILELLSQVGIKDPERVAASYPHQLSGGLRQRAMIAHALAGEPKLLIADEPTSNLDVTVQAKVIQLFKDIRRQKNLTIILITHDLGLIEHIADKVVVMQKGKVVEQGGTQEILKTPQHIYTKELIQAF